ncbi:MAG TPA: hypothetical protein VGZ33_03100 [Acidimicrobiales bacterium]|nr:hypothetical protein [Acidimicrobiales bacterium]
MFRHKCAALVAWIGVSALVVATSSLSSTGASAAPRALAPPQLGFNTYVQDLCQSDSVWASDAVGQFTELQALGANSIALAFPFYTSSLKSSTLFTRRTCGTNYQTPSPARLAVAIDEAKALHLRVFLRPILNETVLGAEHGWRGTIKPRNVNEWFRSYFKVLTPYLKLAHRERVNWFAISTELDSMQTQSNWAWLIASTKRYYRGPLIFTDTWHPNTVTQPGTLPGLDAYQGALVPNSATPTQLLAAWNYALNVSDPLPFPISSATIDEVAIVAQDGAYPRPWSWSLDPRYFPFNQYIQANWYSMVCSFFREHNLQGVYFWGVWYADGANALPQTPSPGLAQEIQPASAAVIQSCFTGT